MSGAGNLGLVALALLAAAAWVGHACIWTYLLNNLYGRPLPKAFLKPFRLVCGVAIAAAPLLPLSAFRFDFVNDDWEPLDGVWGRGVAAYTVLCTVVGLVVFPAVTARRLLRRLPPAVLAASTRTLDLWPELGHELIGDGLWKWVPRLPLNQVFRVDFTDLTLAIPRLPPAWDGLTMLLLSDFHFHGTPSRAYFQRIIDEINRRPPADIVALAGDFVDTDEHHAWIGPLLGQLKWAEAGLAILGNHDDHYRPDRTRGELVKLGYRVISNRWEEATIRGVRCVVVGHEGPWIGPPPDLADAPPDLFRLCLSHTPDNFYWGRRYGIDLMLCGHVHGGQVRAPVVGSIFVPSVYSRRFDMGVFQEGGTVMVVGRGVGGKEPLRFRCNAQVVRLTLTPAA